MARAQLRLLQRKLKSLRLCQRLLHRLCAVPDHDHLASGTQSIGHFDHVCDQGLTPKGVQDLGQATLHARALAACHNHHIQGNLWILSLS